MPGIIGPGTVLKQVETQLGASLLYRFVFNFPLYLNNANTDDGNAFACASIAVEDCVRIWFLV